MNKIRYKDFNDICRLCLKRKFIMKPIFKDESDEKKEDRDDFNDDVSSGALQNPIKLTEKILKVTNLQVIRNYNHRFTLN